MPLVDYTAEPPRAKPLGGNFPPMNCGCTLARGAGWPGRCCLPHPSSAPVERSRDRQTDRQTDRQIERAGRGSCLVWLSGKKPMCVFAQTPSQPASPPTSPDRNLCIHSPIIYPCCLLSVCLLPPSDFFLSLSVSDMLLRLSRVPVWKLGKLSAVPTTSLYRYIMH